MRILRSLRVVGVLAIACMVAFACGSGDEKRAARSDGGEAGDDQALGGGGGTPQLALGGEAGAAAGDGQAPLGGDAGSGGQVDPSNAGQAGAGAGGAGPELPAMPVVLVPFPMINAAQIIAVDSDYVYFPGSWVGPNPPTPLPPASGSFILRVPKAGGEVTPVFEAPAGKGLTTTLIAVDDTSVYTAYGIDVFTDKIIKLPKAELTSLGDEVEIARTPRFGATTFALTADRQRVYFGTGSGGLQSVALIGGAVGTVIDATGTPPVEVGYFPSPSGVVSDATNLYYSGNADGIFRVPVGGGELVQMQPAIVDAVRVTGESSFPTVHDGWVYWSYYGTIYKRPIVGGTLTTVFTPATHGSNYKDVAIDDQYIYSLHDGGLWKTSLDGATRVLMAAGAGYDRLVIDEANVYLTAAAYQSIVKIPKSYVQP